MLTMTWRVLLSITSTTTSFGCPGLEFIPLLENGASEFRCCARSTTERNRQRIRRVLVRQPHRKCEIYPDVDQTRIPADLHDTSALVSSGFHFMGKIRRLITLALKEASTLANYRDIHCDYSGGVSAVLGIVDIHFGALGFFRPTGCGHSCFFRRLPSSSP